MANFSCEFFFTLNFVNSTSRNAFLKIFKSLIFLIVSDVDKLLKSPAKMTENF